MWVVYLGVIFGFRVLFVIFYRVLCYSLCLVGEECWLGIGSETVLGFGDFGCLYIEFFGFGSFYCSFWSIVWRVREKGIFEFLVLGF